MSACCSVVENKEISVTCPHTNRLVNLMGHASKQMIYEVYGKYTKGLERDRLAILRYFGKERLQNTALKAESPGRMR